MHRVARVACCVTLLTASTAEAQRPDFSGTWIRSDSAAARSVATAGDAAFRRGDMGTGWGAVVSIAQRADSLILEYDFFSAYDLQPRVRFAYALDGSESRNGLMVGHAESVQRSRLTWRDGTLVITTQHPMPKAAGGSGAMTEVRQALTLESANSMMVETTRAGALGGAAATTRAVYTRK